MNRFWWSLVIFKALLIAGYGAYRWELVGEKAVVADDLKDWLDLPEVDLKGGDPEVVRWYLSVIEEKKAKLDAKFATLEEHETKLERLRQTIDQQLATLEEKQVTLKETLQKEKELQKERLDQLVKFYTKLPPKKAAPIFEKIDKDIAIKLFDRLPEKVIMGILSVMNPEKSVELTEYYSRHRSGKEFEILEKMDEHLREAFKVTCANP